MTTFTFAESAFVPLAVGFFGLVAAAATSGIASIDVPYFKGDEAGLKREAAASRKLGMTARQLCMPNSSVPSSSPLAYWPPG
jgi:citrate lyase beta subunit